MCAPFCVPRTVNTVEECVIAKTGGKVQNATYQSMIAEFRIVLAEDGACQRVSANVRPVGEANPARKWIVWTPRALVTERASSGGVTAKPVGKGRTAASSTSRCTGACQVAATMAVTTWKLVNACVTGTGPELTVRKVSSCISFCMRILTAVAAAALDPAPIDLCW